MTEPKQPGEILRGRDETTPLRAFSRVGLVVGVVFVLICAAAYGVWTAFN
ncbi:MAG TPA: hypothetical protein VFJ77_07395 [Gaiellaceae bacterium]|nr:hypothetical protein [Gaiellaceae bacterium]